MQKVQLKEIATKLYEGVYRKVVIDSRLIRKGDIFFALQGENVHGNSFIEQALKKGASLVVAELRKDCPMQEKVIAVRKPEDNLWRLGAEMVALSQAKRIGITGSNGKTTTKDMVALALGSSKSVVKTEGNFNNQLGVPITLCSIKKNHKYAVVEMGTNSPGEIESLCKLVKPHITVVTSIDDAHLSGLKNLAMIAQEKSSIYRFAPDSLCLYFKREYDKHKVVRDSLQGKRSIEVPEGINDSQLSSIKIKSNGTEFLYKGEKFSIESPAEHNIENAMVAVTIAEHESIKLDKISKRLAEWRSANHRMNIVSWKKRKLIDDCYNSNPASVKNALKTALSLKQNEKQKVFVAFGDMKELGSKSTLHHKELGALMADMGIEVLLTLGQESKKTLKNYDMNGGAICHHCEGPADMVSFIKIYSRPHDIILIKGSRSMHMEKVVDDLMPAGA